MIVVRVTLLTGKRKTRLDTEFCLIFVLCLIFAFFFRGEAAAASQIGL